MKVAAQITPSRVTLWSLLKVGTLLNCTRTGIDAGGNRFLHHQMREGSLRNTAFYPLKS
jgi:hypothetical protein